MKKALALCLIALTLTSCFIGRQKIIIDASKKEPSQAFIYKRCFHTIADSDFVLEKPFVIKLKHGSRNEKISLELAAAAPDTNPAPYYTVNTENKMRWLFGRRHIKVFRYGVIDTTYSIIDANRNGAPLLHALNINLYKNDTVYSNTIGKTNTRPQYVQPFQWDLFFDEDFLVDALGLNKDKNYTGGGSMQFSGQFAKHIPGFRQIQDCLDRLIHKKNIAGDPAKVIRNYMIRFGNTGFTPHGAFLKETTPVAGDRPYGNITFLSREEVIIDTSANQTAVGSEFTLGALGTMVTREIQTSIHHLSKNHFSFSNKEPDPTNAIRPYYPLGWDLQISNGGEPTFLYTIYKKQLKQNKKFCGSKRWGWQLSDYKSASIGYYNMAKFGYSFRIGKLDKGWWVYSSNPNNGYIEGTTASANKAIPKPKNISHGSRFCYAWRKFWQNSRGYFYANGRAEVMLYNVLLQGQFRKSAYTIDAGDVQHLLFQAEAGFYWSPCKRFGLNLVFAARTAEFAGEYAEPHYWGSVYLTYYGL